MPDAFSGKSWTSEDGYHIDVRGLNPPEPMVAILGYIDQHWKTGIITIHHDRAPIYLFPELAERKWGWKIVPGGTDEVRLLLEKLP